MNEPLLHNGDDVAVIMDENGHKKDVYFAGDPDEFFPNLYDYFIGRGVKNILLSSLFELLNLLFLFLVFVFLILCVDLKALNGAVNGLGKECPDGTTISSPSLFFPDCFGHQPIHFEQFDDPNAFVVSLGVIFAFIYCIYIYIKLIAIYKAFKMRPLFVSVLNISSNQLDHMQWREVVDKLMHAYNEEKRITFPGQFGKMTPLVVKAMILRQQNGLLGLYRYHLNLRSPFSFSYWLCCFSANGAADAHQFVEYLPKTLHIILKYIIKSNVFVKDTSGNRILQSRLREGGYSKVEHNLRKKFFQLGIVIFLVSPLMIVYYFTSFAISFADVIKSSPGNLALRQWTHSAKYRFRRHNELDHYMEQRLQRAYKPTKDYIDSFVSRTTVLVARFLLFMAGTGVLITFVASQFYDDTFLQFTFFADRSVFWTLTNLLLIMGVCRGLVAGVRSGKTNTTLWNDAAKELIIFDDEWAKNPSHPNTCSAISGFFISTLWKHIYEMFAFVFVPFILLGVLPKQAKEIALFYYKNFSEVEGLGSHDIRVANAIRRERGLPEVDVDDQEGVENEMYSSTAFGSTSRSAVHESRLDFDFTRSVFQEE
eukprot:m.96338 g.96338  ORF g.96338 m.96338 type:complete len:595 (+) comp12462_c0_seq2:1543-3327(+)